MGLLAVYAGVPTGVADRLADVDPDDAVEYVESVLESGAPSVDIDKAWDGLHYLLTGRTATDPIEDDALSEAVVGVYAFESDDLVGVTPHDELSRIIDALEAVDLDALLHAVDFPAFTAAEVYPETWADEPADWLRAAFADVLNIHRLCQADRLDLLVSIY
ncbi:DUF1877 family protein [Gordonia liuliyuniae]|uniref:YfbM family protein n=1 Tax=Gordonia liuliyuniae TaxID=2911517 RepID=A0ABS9IS86_9ACTN|nr:DUF1877 family protein [Gordonia liuliyuniae]MCF8588425.1 YfbM family protein [Gordonia liuliyuniae]